MIPGIAPAIVLRIGSGLLFQEDWSGFSAGDKRSDLTSAGYTLFGASSDNDGSPGFVGLTSNVVAPAGVAIKFGGNYNNAQAASRADVKAAILAGGWGYVEVCALMLKSGALIGCLDSVGWPAPGYGVKMATGASGNAVIKVHDQNFDNNNGTLFASGIDTTSPYFFRLQFYDDDRIRAKAWSGDYGDEPVSWCASKQSPAAWSSVLVDLQFGAFATVVQLLGFTVGIDTPAVPDWT